eukprot:scaffold31251_cov19-Prasinocladus_malaysianus.AAC.1
MQLAQIIVTVRNMQMTKGQKNGNKEIRCQHVKDTARRVITHEPSPQAFKPSVARPIAGAHLGKGMQLLLMRSQNHLGTIIRVVYHVIHFFLDELASFSAHVVLQPRACNHNHKSRLDLYGVSFCNTKQLELCLFFMSSLRSETRLLASTGA